MKIRHFKLRYITLLTVLGVLKFKSKDCWQFSRTITLSLIYVNVLRVVLILFQIKKKKFFSNAIVSKEYILGLTSKELIAL